MADEDRLYATIYRADRLADDYWAVRDTHGVRALRATNDGLVEAANALLRRELRRSGKHPAVVCESRDWADLRRAFSRVYHARAVAEDRVGR